MNSYLNYLTEANICLLVFLLLYWLVLRKETNFNFKRFFLLGSIFFSLTFPMIEISGNDSIPSISKVLPAYFLPELVIGEVPEEVNATNVYYLWKVTAWVYISGVILFFSVFAVRVISLWIHIRKATLVYQYDTVKVLELKTTTSVFSFFNYIIIGTKDELATSDRDRIIRHEMTHATHYHSIDIILVELMRIMFWFNPAVHLLKKIISNVHEFQADDQAVKNQDVQMYCSLLARMTLKSAGLSLANHFNKSLTLKRIIMLKTVKKKMKAWKYALIFPVIISIFIVVACQEQVMDDLNTVVQNSSAALDVPANVQSRYEELKKANPGSQYLLMELQKEGQEKLKEMEKMYGLPKSIEVFQLGEDTYEATGNASIKGAASGIQIRNNENLKDDSRTFAIIEYNDQVQALSDKMVQDEIFTVVEENAQPKEGIEKFYEFISSHMKYPNEAKNKGITGRVFLEFIIEKDGSLTNLKVLKGIGHGCDDEAMRVLAMSPPWNPGLQRGLAVRQKMVMPIVFNSGQATTNGIESQVMKMIIETGPVQEVDGKMLLTGRVKDESGNPMKGAHVIAKGQTHGTITDDNGMFQLMSENKIPLVISFVGYRSEEIGYD